MWIVMPRLVFCQVYLHTFTFFLRAVAMTVILVTLFHLRQVMQGLSRIEICARNRGLPGAPVAEAHLLNP
jgi:hypothetical protein